MTAVITVIGGGGMTAEKAVPAGAVGFVFEPRKLAAHPRQFGNTAMPLRAAESTDERGPRWRAALLQHHVANRVRESLAVEGTNLFAWVAQRKEVGELPAGLTYDRLIRIQRGESMMQLADLFHWASTYPAVAELLHAHRFGIAPHPGQQ